MAMDDGVDERDDFAIDQTKRPGLLVLLTGIGTSLLTLAGLFALNIASPEHGNVMGWYANFIIPVGALLVGFAAGSGYGIASWITGAKIGKKLMLQIIVLQVACYFISQYVEFRFVTADLPPNVISFWEYFDVITRSFAWNDHGKAGNAFGMWGYAMRALEIGGFALGALFVPAILLAAPYCDRCQVYMKKKDLGLLPSGVTERKIGKKDVEGQKAYAEELQAGLDAGQKLLEQLKACVAQGNAQRFVDILHEHKGHKKEIEKQTSRMMVSMECCKRCDFGRAVVRLFVGHDPKQTPAELWKTDLESEFVRDAMLYYDDRKQSPQGS